MMRILKGGFVVLMLLAFARPAAAQDSPAPLSAEPEPMAGGLAVRKHIEENNSAQTDAAAPAGMITPVTSATRLAANTPDTDIPPEAQGGIIREIQVEGVQRIEPDTVKSYLSLSVGEETTRERINESLKSLFATGFFSDAKITAGNGVLRVKVVENPVINRVVFEGNHAIDKKDLEKEIQLRARQIYTKSRVQADTQRIRDVYRRSGRFAAIIEPKIITLEQNRVDLVFEITEGDRTGVRRIEFIGNNVFDDDELREAVNTRETAWWRFFSSSDFYDPDRMNFDKELLRRFYLNEGYVDFRVLSSHAELMPDRKDFILTFTVEEGQRYRFGKINLATTLPSVNIEKLKENLTVHEGEWYSAERVEKSVVKFTAAIGDLQYGFAQVQPRLDLNKEKHTVDINFTVNEGPRVFVARIDITGNTRTLDQVLRRQMKLSEGDPYLVSKVKKSEQDIRDLGYFETVKVSAAEGTQPDQSVINVEVKEKSTGEISIGAGYSSTDGPLGDFTIRERNLLGKGQDLRFSVQASPRTQQYDVSFTEPYFLERDLAAGFDLFRITRDNQSESSFDEARNGGTLRIGYPLSETLRQRWNYGIQQTTISSVPASASRFVREQQGTVLTSMVGHELMYDKRDSKLDPKHGFYLRLNNDIAGLGGDSRYLRTKLGAAYYVPVTENEKWVLTIGGEAGYIFGLGQNVRINDRFYLGGESLRGFAYGGVGPRDLTGAADDSLGGNRFVRSRVEVSFPTGLPEEFGIRGRIFNDAGILDSVDAQPLPGENFKEDSNLRMSMGAGVTWQSPFGPIGVDLAQAVLKESYDKTEFFRFSFGTRF